MTLMTWTNPKKGAYTAKHCGKQLEVMYAPNGNGFEKKKPYRVVVDGVFTDIAWSIKEAKSKAMKIAEATHKNKGVAPYEDREIVPDNEESAANTDKREAKEVGTSIAITDFTVKRINGHSKAVEPEGVASVPQAADKAGIIPPLTNYPDLTQTAPAVKKTGLALTFPETVPEAGSVTFSLSGSFDLSDMATTNALNTLEAAVQLLREHGKVSCRVTVPSTIDL